MKNRLIVSTLPLILWFACTSLPFSYFFSAAENNPTSIADLSPKDKKAFIKQIIETGNCSWKGIKLHGKVQFVSSFPDIKIQYVSSFADIKVKFVSSFPDDCGEWQKVSSFPDFKVQIVTSFPDLKVQKVSSFPGMN
jgi:hypothetical protein